jgi:multidrug efflux system outer membrane protein
VFFNGNAGFSANSIGALGNPATDTYGFGPQITWAALDLGHVRARILAAHARADAELAAYEKTVLIALEETENALVDFGRERTRRQYLQESVTAAAAATALARQRYEGGIADFLPVLDTERTQLDVEAQLARSETRTATTLVAVYKALGGGWNTPEQNQASK